MADAKYTLRFVGRFVFAHGTRQTADGDSLPEPFVDVLALNMQFSADAAADPHRFFMSAPRGRVVQPGGRPLNLVLMASVPDTDHAEQAVWELTGHDVSFNAGGGFVWDDKSTIADLNDLVTRTPPGNGRKVFNSARPPAFNKTLLAAAEKSDLLNGAIRIASGRGAASQFVSSEVDFVQLPFADRNVGKSLKIADLVTIRLTLPEESPLHVTLTPRNGGPRSVITLTQQGETIVTFTNLCTRPTRQVDDEFAAMYEVLQDAPAVRDRLVPKSSVGGVLVGTEDCYPPAFVSYEVG